MRISKMPVPVPICSERSRIKNRHLVEVEEARGLEKSEAGEGNRTLVISRGRL